ncbi:triose-phosphate isomerase [Desulforamulus hydrothermalis]|uniref:Triosephosphate isomerase n=1 Tax=Desulforamulus hydrothermalis Lam5 = DSM 18033 TaxID=1121428 RepID=K8EAJ5_9FIRM|nr:triose-phosphate isomerase [Desulforamulus hydrothermalis]CCO08653.1 Triosephosphate isomerase [Desulforamulus hydrothermalis Lam5 = DSM 18033]
MRQKIIAGNWKMHKTTDEARQFVQALQEKLTDCRAAVVICPPFTALAAVAEVLAGSKLALGAQNMHWADQGAYTGEISPLMLQDCGCRYVILGHSERRQYFGETDGQVNQKVKAALAHGLLPVVCVGETLAQRQGGLTETVVGSQTAAALAGLTPEQVAGLVIAYEPVWAIGTGQTASEQDAQQVNQYIRALLAEQYGQAAAAAVRILYGGSVKPANAASLLAQPDIDGALVGGASLKAADFLGIIQAV